KTVKLSGGRRSGNPVRYQRWCMSIRRHNGNEPGRGELLHRDKLRGQERRIEMNRRGNRCRENVDRPRRCMGVRLLHVDNAFVFRNFQFRKVRMNHGRPTLMRVHMEKGSVSRRKNERDDRTECGYSWHPGILLKLWHHVNASQPEFLLMN